MRSVALIAVILTAAARFRGPSRSERSRPARICSRARSGRSWRGTASSAMAQTTRHGRRSSGSTCASRRSKPTASGAIPIVPGKPDESELVSRIFADDASERMPPPRPRTRSPTQTSRFSSAGSPTERSTRTTGLSSRPGAGPPPQVRGTSWPQNAIDAFILARLEAAGLKPSEPADRATLIRRAVARPDRLAADARGGRRLRARPFARRLREAGRSAAGLAPLRRALGAALARPGPLCRHQRLREGPHPLDLALPRLGDPGPERRHALRPVHDRAARRRPAAGRDRQPADRHRLSSQHDAQRRRGHRPAGVPLLRDDRPRRHHGDRLAGPDARLRPVPYAQVRPDPPSRLLPVHGPA